MENRTNDSWLWQILAILGSALSMIAIGMLLIHFNNRPIFDWNGLTLNAIIAIFSVISKSMLAYTLSECLGQAKWIWISSQQRPLNDINVIDSGSRGPLGSFKILTQPMIRSFISVGAIVVILSVVIDPFVQLTIGKADSVNFDKNSNVQIAYAKSHSPQLRFVSNASDDIVVAPRADLGMRSAVFDGLFQSDSWISQQTQRSCSSGNCTWDTFTSLAICSGCNDLTNHIKRVNAMVEFQGPFEKPVSGPVPMYWYLPNGPMIANPSLMNAWGTNNATQTISFTSFNTLIWAMTIMNLTQIGPMIGDDTLSAMTNLMNLSLTEPTTSDTTSAMMNIVNLIKRQQPLINHHNVSAIECGLWYCVNSYQSTVRNGILSEIVQPAASQRKPGSWQPIRSDSAKGGFKTIAPPRYLNTPSLRSANPFTRHLNRLAANLVIRRTDLQIGEGFNISQAAYFSLTDLLREVFTYTFDQADSISNSITNLTLPISPGYNVTITPPSDFKHQNAMVIGTNPSQGPDDYNPPAMENLYHSQDLEATFAKLAKSITNSLRQASDRDNHTVITGKEGKYVVLIRIRAWFLALPALLIFGGSVFLVLILHHTRKSGIEFWGTNALPIVHLGGKMEPIFDENDMKTSTMEHKAKKHLVQFSAFRPPRHNLDRVDTISRSENHEMIPPSRISADVVSIISPSRTSLVVQSPSPDASSIVSSYA